MKIEGVILEIAEKGEKPRIIVDAEPHVMQRLRKIFDNSTNYWERGKYTHKPIVFPFTLNACKDLIWLLERYNLEVDKPLLDKIQGKSDEYDQILKNLSTIDKNPNLKLTPDSLKMAIELRIHQIQFKNMLNSVKRMLLADKMGVGKTYSGLSSLAEPENRPALIVVPSYLCSQWEKNVKTMYPDATTHVIRGFKNYELPNVDVLITSYNRLQPWQDVLCAPERFFKTLLMDEVQELRKLGTAKRYMCRLLSEKVNQCIGMSGTPIYNYGEEIWSIMDVIKPDCLGELEDFKSEWCSWERVYEPATLNSFLKNQGLMLRRTPEEVGLNFGDASKHVITIDADLNKLKEVQDVNKMLALSVLSGNVGEMGESTKQFDWKLRHATGVAKARPVAEFVKMIVEDGEKVLLAAWHRDVYDIYMKELAAYHPVLYTGTESPAEKDKAVKEFVEGKAQIFIISSRSGAGLDGLQKVCCKGVQGELDWSPQVHNQLVQRLDRDGQKRHVDFYYPVITDGSDPFMLNIIGVKNDQHDGIIDGIESEATLLATAGAGRDRIRQMAETYLKSIGEEIPEVVEEVGLLGEITSVIRRLRITKNTEDEMQSALDKVLRETLNKDITIEREHKITKRSRVDFMINRGDEKIAIECKIETTKRTEVYRQVRRYVEESNIKALILVAPWYGIPSFKVDGVPVIVIDTNINSI